ncbi:MAG: hypothetical protein IPN95_12225 [Bacteroidetes bacterium]|nr:hypothetical protein [Bacteroidota bacterium]
MVLSTPQQPFAEQIPSNAVDRSETSRKMASGKTVVITGANSGIGLASAQILAGKGWNVDYDLPQSAKRKGIGR